MGPQRYGGKEVQGAMIANNPEDESVNPYEPPIADAAIGNADETHESQLDVELVGRPTDEELQAFLAEEKSGNLVGLLGLLGFLIMPLLVVVIQHFLLGLLAIVGGVCGLILFMYIVSGVRYRAGVFKNEFPQWDAFDGGRIDSDGVTVFEGDSWSMFHWEWFSHVIVCKNVISFMPNLKSKCPVLIGQKMVCPGVSANVVGEWERVSKDAVELLERTRSAFYKNRLAIDPSQARSNMALICNRQRRRTVSVEAGAFPFSGDVSTADLERIPRGNAGLKRTRRSRLVLASVLLFGGLIVSGISELWLDAFWILLVFYFMLILSWTIRAWTTRVDATARRYCFILGYATDERLVIDLGIAVSSFAWRDMKLLANVGDLLAIKAGRRGPVVVLRPDMFQNPEQWKQTLDTVMLHAQVATA
ncbi:MAG: hypothetical protein CMM01_15830 [Rhodopirellula sp.]|nr:hypothetical protein [Rhodopirellula sp.]